MSVTLVSPPVGDTETVGERFVMQGIRWDAYARIAAWGRLGVPELWRFDAATFSCTFWNRRDDGTYEQVVRSKFLPMLDASDVSDQIRRANELGSSKWYRQLEDWVRDAIRPRIDGGDS
jgi:hypothetical protein